MTTVVRCFLKLQYGAKSVTTLGQFRLMYNAFLHVIQIYTNFALLYIMAIVKHFGSELYHFTNFKLLAF